mmetsp:Transcript_17334/g.24693  ORF Transcript_17334/g.24693 Transcript_17334/m.24693 type:complete len:95 (+) Transcript_17334:2199-2483(+)
MIFSLSGRSFTPFLLVASAAAEQSLYSTEEALDQLLTEREGRVKIYLTKTVRHGETITMGFHYARCWRSCGITCTDHLDLLRRTKQHRLWCYLL